MTEVSENITNGKIRIVDDEGHLLFVYNPATRTIEFVPIRGRRLDGKRKVLCLVDTDALRSAGTHNLLSDSPVHEIVADVEVIDV